MAAPSSKHRPDLALLISIIVLILIGTVLISSAAVVVSQQLTGNPNTQFIKHLWALAIGAVFFGIAYKIDYTFWRKAAPYMIIAALIGIILIFVPGIGFSSGGATRAIHFGSFNFSPTEFYKLALIIYLAAWLEKRGKNVRSFLYSAVPFFFIVGLSIFLIIMQPDMGTTMVVTATAFVMYVVAGASISHIVAMIAMGIAGIIFLIKTEPYRMSRFMIFLNPTSDQSGAGYQINQALLAIGTGGLFGLGFGQSRQKFNYLPEAASDSIFAVTAEELGFFRSALIVGAYLILVFQGYRVAQKAPDAFSRLLAVGITTWIGAQALINISAMLSIIPLTGVPLPFISMGSSSTVMLMLASGILLNISRHTQGETRENRSYWRRNWWTYFTHLGRN
jgi:cell division protein FtsW